MKLSKFMRIFSLTFFLSLLVMTITSAFAATYYIATNGSNGNNGSSSAPWATFSYAIGQMSSGDKLVVKAGTYNQAIDVTKSNITIEGELDGSGNRLSIIDPYTTVNPNNWQVATGYGAGGAYKITGLGYETYALYIVDGGVPYKVLRLCQYTEDNNYSTQCQYAASYLTKSSTATGDVMYQCPNSDRNVYNICQSSQYRPNYWDGKEALFTSDSSGTVYIKFRNGDKPANYTIRVAQNTTATVNISSKEYITIKNLEIRATGYGVYVYNSSNITIDNNKIILGREKIRFYTVSNSVISNNIVTAQWYGQHIESTYGQGPWSCKTSSEDVSLCTNLTRIREHLYYFTKYQVNGNTSSQHGLEDYSINILYGTQNIVISGNKVFNVGNGINGYHAGFEVKNNEVYGTSSQCVGWDPLFNGTASVHDNLIYNCNLNIRLQDYDAGGNSQAQFYIYNNKFWLPANLSHHINYHFGSGGTITNATETWWYHNSFSGGGDAVLTGESNYLGWGNEALNKTYYINNVFSSPKFEAESYWPSVGMCEYSWFSATSGVYGACGATNIKNQSPIWSYSLSSPPDFILPNGSNAISSGKDISQSFTINGTTYTALPGFSPGYFSGSKSNIGAINPSPPPPPPPPAPTPGAPILLQ